MYNRLLELVIIQTEISAVNEYALKRHTTELILLGNTWQCTALIICWHVRTKQTWNVSM